LSAVSFLGGFQTPAGPQMTSRVSIRPPSETHHGTGLRANFREWPLLEDEPPFPAGISF
jgi:hypothetical protein